MVHDLVVPWRAGAVVAVVVAAHVVVAGEPCRIVVDSLARFVRRVRTRLAARRYVTGELAFADLPQTWRQVDQNPMKEIHARQRGRHRAVLLIDVVALARDVRVVADEGE
ncbi:MAG: hypothetical protein AW07_01058 [Candidatus Accumulibacter sp. SK-11]|nr:MAG: hypothetical protein AW07_01058 [Candidatus Accumulibacter sp. SK-11]